MNKELILLNSINGEIISNRKVQKKITVMKDINIPNEFKKYYKEIPNKILLAGDKVGEILVYPLPNINSQENLLLGHCASIITSFTFSNDKRYIITSDRDEKIRISNFPKANLIANYCLGHKKYVYITCITPNDILLSGDGEGKIIIWNIDSGDIINEYEFNMLFNEDDIHPINRLLFVEPNLICITLLKYFLLYYSCSTLYFFTIESDNQLKLYKTIKYSKSIIDISFINNDKFLCTTKGDKCLYITSIKDGNIEDESLNNLYEELLIMKDLYENYNFDTLSHQELEKEQLKVKHDPMELKGETTTLTPLTQ